VRYPVITLNQCSELAGQLVSGGSPPVDSCVRWIGLGEEVDLPTIEAAAAEITRSAQEWPERDRDRLEGRECIRLLGSLRGVPTEILDDAGFWRFLSVRYFWEFIAWREEEAFTRGNYHKYVDASSSTEAVLPRMYLRARAIGGSAHAGLADAIPEAGDFWRSHIIRVRTGSAPPLTRAFATKQRDERLMTTALREAAKRLNRTWTNVVLHLHDDSSASELIDAIWHDAH
jgi:hypothetical protein